jgi:hypothetical protein
MSVNKVILERMYVTEKKSIPDIAKELEMKLSTVRYWLVKLGIELRSRADGVRAATHKLGSGLRGKTRIFSNEWKENISKGRISYCELHAAGISIKPSGYVEITRGENKYRSQHRVIMEDHLGRKLRSDEIVHHKDENKTNNLIENLAVMSASEHAKHHAKDNYKTRTRNQKGRFV